MHKLTDYQKKLLQEFQKSGTRVIECAEKIGVLTITVTVNKQSQQTESNEREMLC